MTRSIVAALIVLLTLPGALLAQEQSETTAEAGPQQTTPTGDPPDPRQSSPSTARPRTQREQTPVESWAKLQALFFQNFFWASQGEPEEDVTAGQAEVGTSLRLSRTQPVRAFGTFNYMTYDHARLDDTHGFRVGVRSQMRPHSFEVYADRQRNRPTFDVGDQFDRADISTLSAEYGWRFTPDWELGLHGQLQEQEFRITTDRDNEFGGGGASIRYRGWRVSPEVGFQLGRRDVDLESESYDQRDLYLQLRSSVTDRIYVSLRLRNRTRDYTISDPGSSNFGREDDRRQISGSFDWRFARNLTWSIWASHDVIDVSRTNRPGYDFDTTLVLTGLTFHF
jgi:hypothetical protein